MPDHIFAANQPRCIIQATKQLFILVSRVGWSMSSTQKWKKELVIGTDTQISEKCNNQQSQLALRQHYRDIRLPAICVDYNVLSVNLEDYIWGDPLTQAGPETKQESPIEKINFLFVCFLASATLSILVLKCSRTAAPKYFPDKFSINFVIKIFVCDSL